MAAPVGYIAVGTVGYTNKGNYSAYETYNRFNTVLYDNSTWVCRQDNTVGIPPAEGASWHLMAKGYVLVTDQTPVSGSHNPVESDGVYQALSNLNSAKQDKFRNVLLSQELSFAGTDAVIANSLINASTHAYVFYSDDSVSAAAAAKITVTTESGLIRFRANNPPTDKITCDIIFDN